MDDFEVVLSADPHRRWIPYSGGVVISSLSSWLDEPRAPFPPARTWKDWAVVLPLATMAVGESFFGDRVAWPPVALILGCALAASLLWRRSHPLLMVVATFGLQAAFDVATLVLADSSTITMSTFLVGLVLVYSLLRWGSGRESAMGMALVVVAHLLNDANDPQVGVVESVVGMAVWMFAAALGATMRYRAGTRLRAIEEARTAEREQLARELHDTVAHHVSAIVVQAQAGRAVAAADSDAALRALEVIEDAASRTLGEMRAMVGALRADDSAPLGPQRSIRDLALLADAGGGSPAVDVELVGDLDHLRPSVASAVFRLAQESITNARRHARHATRVSVLVEGTPDQVTVTVADDGDSPSASSSSGYGLVGMAERAKLLGGTFVAGPRPGRGWHTVAEIPRDRPKR